MTDSNMRYGTLEWLGDFRFTAGAAGKPSIVIDGNSGTGPSPVITLLLAAGACSGSDVVDILRKGKVELTKCSIDVSGKRRDDWPKRYVELSMRFTLAGQGLTRTKAERAVELSVTKYCSVVQSLNPDIPVTTEIVIEGEGAESDATGSA